MHFLVVVVVEEGIICDLSIVENITQSKGE